MTQNLLGFDELPVDSQVSIPSTDRGTLLYGRAISPASLVGGTTLFAETKFVAKNGNDATGDGSVAKPFLTIAAALASITDATSAKPYGVLVAPGVYTETFAIKAWCYVQGLSALAVYLNPITANWIDASFAAGTQDGGIGDVTLLTNLTVDFSLVASAGAGSFKLFGNVVLGSAVALVFKGNNSANVVQLGDLMSIGPTSSPLTLTNITSNVGSCNLRNGVLTITGTDAYSCTHRFESLSTGGTINVTWTGADTTKVLSVTFYASPLPVAPSGGLVITGAGASVYSRGVFQINAPNADTTFSFGRLPPGNGGTVLPQGADIIIVANPSVDRTYTFEGSGVPGTRVRLVNQSNVNCKLAYAAGAGSTTGVPSYVQPFQIAQLLATSNLLWDIVGMTQFFQVQLNNGVSAAIPADIDLNSTITATLRTFNTATGIIAAKGADRVNGTFAGGGSFKLTSVTAAGATTVTDQSTYDVQIVGLGTGT